jgi:hypothetical protein
MTKRRHNSQTVDKTVTKRVSQVELKSGGLVSGPGGVCACVRMFVCVCMCAPVHLEQTV